MQKSKHSDQLKEALLILHSFCLGWLKFMREIKLSPTTI